MAKLLSCSPTFFFTTQCLEKKQNKKSNFDGGTKIKKSNFFNPSSQNDKMRRKLLTRAEMWTAICSKCPPLHLITTEARYRNYHSYVHRGTMFKILIALGIHRSRHLKKSQKMKIKYELNLRTLEKI